MRAECPVEVQGAAAKAGHQNALVVLILCAAAVIDVVALIVVRGLLAKPAPRQARFCIVVEVGRRAVRIIGNGVVKPVQAVVVLGGIGLDIRTEQCLKIIGGR